MRNTFLILQSHILSIASISFYYTQTHTQTRMSFLSFYAHTKTHILFRFTHIFKNFIGKNAQFLNSRQSSQLTAESSMFWTFFDVSSWPDLDSKRLEWSVTLCTLVRVTFLRLGCEFKALGSIRLTCLQAAFMSANAQVLNFYFTKNSTSNFFTTFN